ncbi:hypothetical protein ES332_A05G119900v1 [Gossypium tomentosum]|uniref:Uncharacterized protein n=1 Tax=Gossypium tomentosum TaxID=34277 RepID=A0A5D2QEK0_GOSTO|nr:hypothetical protein ES332_A05G119900v1 [Gossypium tomentosum]
MTIPYRPYFACYGGKPVELAEWVLLQVQAFIEVQLQFLLLVTWFFLIEQNDTFERLTEVGKGENFKPAGEGVLDNLVYQIKQYWSFYFCIFLSIPEIVFYFWDQTQKT